MKTMKLALALMITATIAATANPIQDKAMEIIGSAEVHGVYSATLDGRHGYGAATLFTVKEFTLLDKVNVNTGVAHVIMDSNHENSTKFVRGKRTIKKLPIETDSLRNLAQIGASFSMKKNVSEESKLSNLPVVRNLFLNPQFISIYIGVGSYVDEFEPVFSAGVGGIKF